MTNDSPKCDEVINARLEGRLSYLLPSLSTQSLSELYAIAESVDVERDDDEALDDLVDRVQEAHREQVAEGVLSVEKSTTYDVLLSYGGPSDGFKLHHDGEAWTGGEYYFRDWFDGATRTIDAETAEALASLWCVGPEFE